MKSKESLEQQYIYLTRKTEMDMESLRKISKSEYYARIIVVHLLIKIAEIFAWIGDCATNLVPTKDLCTEPETRMMRLTFWFYENYQYFINKSVECNDAWGLEVWTKPTN